MSKIENKWAAYGLLSDFMGKVIEDSYGTVHVLYIEGQVYPPSICYPKDVKRFATPEELAKYMSRPGKICCDVEHWSYEQCMQRLRAYFPSEFKKEDRKRTRCKHDFSYSGKKRAEEIKCKKCNIGMLEWVWAFDKKYNK